MNAQICPQTLSSLAASSRPIAAGALALLLLLGTAACRETPPAPVAEALAGAAEYPRGPHGGRLLQDGPFAVEVTIYERGIPPQFRLFLTENGEPLAPASASVRIALHRLGGRVDQIAFSPQADYLVGDQVVEEPHSFDVAVTASRGAGEHRWSYSQTEGRVQLSDEAVSTSAIEVETAGPRTLRNELELPAEVALDADRVAHVVARTEGVVQQIRKNQGDRVGRGEVIAVIDSRELAEARRLYIDSEHEVVFARRAFEREERLFQRQISAESSYLAAERELHESELRRRSARQQLEALGIGRDSLAALLEQPDGNLTRYELRAPFAGTVVEKRVATGQAVTADQTLCTVADLSSVWVHVTVHPKDLQALSVGEEVTVRSADLGKEAKGKIVHIGELIGGETRSATARVVLADPERVWRPGLFVSVAVVREQAEVPVAVKREGLQKFRDWDVVFVRVGDLFEARPLELGRRDGDWVEVLSGLAAGEKYAGANSFVLKADVGKAGASHDH